MPKSSTKASSTRATISESQSTNANVGQAIPTTAAGSSLTGSQQSLPIPQNNEHEMKMRSLDLPAYEKSYNVENLAEVLDMELKDCTYKDDESLLGKVLLEPVKNTPDSDIKSSGDKSESSIPDFLAGYFGIKKKDLTPARKPLPRNHDNAAYHPNESTWRKHKRQNARDDRNVGGQNDDNSDDGDGGNDGGNDPPKTTPPVPLTTDTDEEKLAIWFNVIRDHLQKHYPQKYSRVFNADASELPMHGETSEQRKPDVLVLDKIPDGNDRKNWRIARGFIEISREINFKRRLMNELPQRAVLLLRNFPTIRFVIILAISDRQFMLTVYHRSGVNYSPKFDIVRDILILYKIIATFSFSPDVNLGLDPDVTLDANSKLESISYYGDSYLVVGVLFVADGIQGRGTVCLVLMNKRTGKKYMMKISWYEDVKDIPSEVDLYMLLKILRIAGVPIMESYFDVLVNGRKDTTEKWKPYNATNFRVRTHRRILLDGLGRPLTDFSSRKELLNGAADILQTLRTLYTDAKMLHQDTSLANMLLIGDYPEYSKHLDKFPDRIKHKPINTATFPKSLKKVFFGEDSAMQGEQNHLGNEVAATTGIGQGDATDVSHKLSRGLLTDFDYATVIRELVTLLVQTDTENIDFYFDLFQSFFAKDIRNMRTGTASFMSIPVLLGKVKGEVHMHTLLDDVESVIYGLMKISIHYSGPKGTLRDFSETPIGSIFSGTDSVITDLWISRQKKWADLGILKSITWSHLETYVIPCIDPYFGETFADLFKEISATMFPYQKMEREDYNCRVNSKADIDDIIAIVKKYRDKLPDHDDVNVPPPAPAPDIDSGPPPGPRRSPRVRSKESSTKVN